MRCSKAIIGSVLIAALALVTLGEELVFDGDEKTLIGGLGADRQSKTVARPGGGWIAVWEERLETTVPPTHSIFGQLFDRDGVAQGSEFPIVSCPSVSCGFDEPTALTDTVVEDAATDAAGQLYVLWKVEAQFDGIDLSRRLVGRFDSTGAFLGDLEIGGAAGFHSSGSMVARPNGDLIVAWDDLPGGDLYCDGHSASVFLQRFDSTGAPQTAVWQISEDPPPGAYHGSLRPDVELDSQGEFVVAWDYSLDSYDCPMPPYDVVGKRFASDGAELSGQIPINTYTTDSQNDPEVALAGGGRFLVVWESLGSSGRDMSSKSIQSRLFADGALIGADVELNTFTASKQHDPDTVPIGENDGYLVVWNSIGSVGSDSDGRSVQARWIGADGQPVQDQFQVNSSTTGDQTAAEVVRLGPSEFLVSWRSDDGTDNELRAQRLILTLFADGFESGDVAAWSGSSN